VAYDLGGGLGIAVLGSILAAWYTAAFTPVPGLTEEQLGTARESIREAHHLATQLLPGHAEQILRHADDAFLQGLHIAITVSIVILAVTAIAATIFVKSAHLADAAEMEM